jgi:protocatechuate 3,4-dioxygenase beta subunit
MKTRIQLSQIHELSRRDFLLASALAIPGARLLAQTPSCTLAAQQEEGPYYIDMRKVRRTITEDKAGVPVQLRVALLDAKRCTPLENAAVDIWHCDALGVYSGFTANGGGENMGRGRGGPGQPGPAGGGRGGRGARGPRGGGRGALDETRFLRGIQLTNKQGLTEFATVYPGWYAGRTIHIHLKVHVGGQAANEQYMAGHVSHTGQLFFPEDVTEQIARMDPYVQHSNVHRTLHSEDNIFRRQGGASSMVTLERLQKGSNADGFIATVTLAVDPEATPRVL